jgi:hypothetical protein
MYSYEIWRGIILGVLSKIWREILEQILRGFRSEKRRFGDYHEVWLYFVLFVV